MEEYTEEEIDLARAYNLGHYNEVQLNYLANQIGSKKERMYDLLDKMSYSDPFVAFAKTILIMIMLHFFACTVYAIASIL
jgi:hypothetical protein